MTRSFAAGRPLVDDLIEVKSGPGLLAYHPAQVIEPRGKVLFVKLLWSQADPAEVPRSRARPLDPLREQQIRRAIVGVQVGRAGSAKVIRTDGAFLPAEMTQVLRAVPKDDKPWRSDKYQRFVRRQPCCAKDGGHLGKVQGHHIGPHPFGQQPGDEQLVPLCAGHHVPAAHDKASLPGMTPVGTRAYFREVRDELWARWEGGER